MNFEKVTDEIALKLLRLATNNACDYGREKVEVRKTQNILKISQKSYDKEYNCMWEWEMEISQNRIKLCHVDMERHETVKPIYNPFEIFTVLNGL